MTSYTKFINCPNPECGMPLEPTEESCPKCDTEIHKEFLNSYLEIDVAHKGQTKEDARQQIIEGLSDALLLQYKGLKVIHGFGGENRNRGVIAREAKYVLQGIADSKGYTLKQDGNNPGAHILVFED